MAFSAISEKLEHSVEPLVVRLAAPSNLGRVAAKFPLRMNKVIVGKILNHAFSEQISDGDFNFLEQRSFQIEISDANLFITLSFDGNKIICTHFADYCNDVEVSLTIDAFNAIRLIKQEVDPDTLFFQRKLQINGDTELAHHVKNTIDTFDPELIPTFILKLLSHYKKRIFTQSD